MVSIKRAAFRRTIIPKNVRIFSPVTTPRSQNHPLKNFKFKTMYTNLKIQKVFPLKCFDLIQKILERFLPRVYLTKWIIYRSLKFYGWHFEITQHIKNKVLLCKRVHLMKLMNVVSRIKNFDCCNHFFQIWYASIYKTAYAPASNFDHFGDT